MKNKTKQQLTQHNINTKLNKKHENEVAEGAFAKLIQQVLPPEGPLVTMPVDTLNVVAETNANIFKATPRCKKHKQT